MINLVSKRRVHPWQLLGKQRITLEDFGGDVEAFKVGVREAKAEAESKAKRGDA